MFDINAQANLFNNTTAIEKLSDEAAATIQGGLFLKPDVTVYRHGGFKDFLGSRSKDLSRLSSNANDQISSIFIRKGRWRFYEHANYAGRSIDFTPGNYNLPVDWNDRISSFRRVG